MDYKEAGVDRAKADFLIEGLKRKISETYNSQVKAGVGGFAALYNIGGGQYLASATDGVGTKLMLAQDLNKHDGIGQDLVAMCLNDLLCTGAKPLFFLDYIATGKLDENIYHSVVSSIADACKRTGCALIGGETAEMPGFYQGSHYDIAGFAVGLVNHDKVLDGAAIKPGDSIIGVASSGFHANGFSLLRKIVKDRADLARDLLEPTVLYGPYIEPLLSTGWVKGLAHITGGGLLNISRLNKEVGFAITDPFSSKERVSIINKVVELSDVKEDELYKTFNMGMGLVIITDKPKLVLEELEGKIFAKTIGEVNSSKQLSFKGNVLDDPR